MKKISKKLLASLFILFIILQGCTTLDTSDTRVDGSKIQIVSTTNIVADLLKQIGGEEVEVTSLMGPGIDPHGYQATAKDNTRIFDANIVAYNGLGLEGQMGEVFAVLEDVDKTVIAIEDAVSTEDLLASEEVDEAYDPHIWFNVELWQDAAHHVTKELSDYDPANESYYVANNEKYQTELEALNDYIVSRVQEVPEDQRYLVTAHDAFSYFGDAYGFEVVGIQGLNTQAEAGTRDISRLAHFIAENEISAIFVETSVSTRNIEALRDAVNAQGHEVNLGGELFSDSLGDISQDAETYTKMYRHNIDTIVNSLKYWSN
jgi:manganese/zinc/iron transport system substrate-binding protein